MMLFELRTNEGRQIVRSDEKTLRRRMFEYIVKKRTLGYDLWTIVFCWSPVHVSTLR